MEFWGSTSYTGITNWSDFPPILLINNELKILLIVSGSMTSFHELVVNFPPFDIEYISVLSRFCLSELTHFKHFQSKKNHRFNNIMHMYIVWYEFALFIQHSPEIEEWSQMLKSGDDVVQEGTRRKWLWCCLSNPISIWKLHISSVSPVLNKES